MSSTHDYGYHRAHRGVSSAVGPKRISSQYSSSLRRFSHPVWLLACSCLQSRVLLQGVWCPSVSLPPPYHQKPAPKAAPTLPARLRTCNAVPQAKPVPVPTALTPATATVSTHHVAHATSVLQVCAPSQTLTRTTPSTHQSPMHGQRFAPALSSGHPPAATLSGCRFLAASTAILASVLA